MPSRRRCWGFTAELAGSRPLFGCFGLADLGQLLLHLDKCSCFAFSMLSFQSITNWMLWYYGSGSCKSEIREPQSQFLSAVRKDMFHGSPLASGGLLRSLASQDCRYITLISAFMFTGLSPVGVSVSKFSFCKDTSHIGLETHLTLI